MEPNSEAFSALQLYANL